MEATSKRATHEATGKAQRQRQNAPPPSHKHKGERRTCRPTGQTMVKRVLSSSKSWAAGWPQKTREAKELNIRPAPYSQQMAGKLNKIACSQHVQVSKKKRGGGQGAGRQGAGGVRGTCSHLCLMNEGDFHQKQARGGGGRKRWDLPSSAFLSKNCIKCLISLRKQGSEGEQTGRATVVDDDLKLE